MGMFGNDAAGTMGNIGSGAATGAAAGGVPGAIIGGIAGLATSAFGANAAEEAAELAYKRQKELYKNRHSWTVEDLKNAGLNPALAYGSGGNASGSFPTVAQANSAAAYQGAADNFSGLGQAANSAAQIQLQANKNQSEINLIDAETDLAKKRAITETGTAAQIAANTRLLDQMVPKVRSEIANLDAHAALTKLESELRGWELQGAPYTLDAKKYAVREVTAGIFAKLMQGKSAEAQAEWFRTGVSTQLKNSIEGIAREAGFIGGATELLWSLFGKEPDMSVPKPRSGTPVNRFTPWRRNP